MTNGQITKKILKAAKTLTGAELTRQVSILLDSFPLSSTKMVYESDASKVPAEAWETVIAACVVSDKRKAERKCAWENEMGLKSTLSSYGRFIVK